MVTLHPSKEVDDALDGKSVADMTRAKQMKSLFRMITPHLTLKDIPAVVVNHTYKEIGLFPKDIVSGGTAFTIVLIISSSLVDNKRKKEPMLSDTILSSMWKSQDTSVKSQRYQLRSRGKRDYKWSGLLDMALESGHVVKPSNGWYAKSGDDDAKKYRTKDTYSKEFWMPILQDQSFVQWIEDRYLMSADSIMQEEVSEEDIRMPTPKCDRCGGQIDLDNDQEYVLIVQMVQYICEPCVEDVKREFIDENRETDFIESDTNEDYLRKSSHF